MFVIYYFKIQIRFCRVNFDNKILKRKNGDTFAPLSVVPDKEDSVLPGFSYSFASQRAGFAVSFV